MLAALAPASLARMRFPLGELTKPEVRAIAAGAGLPVAGKADSPGPVLPGRDEPGAFPGPPRRRRRPPGPRGRRRRRGARATTTASTASPSASAAGSGSAGGEPLYVLDKDAASGRVTVGPLRAPCAPRAVAIRGARLHRAGARVDRVKLRYRQSRWRPRVAGDAAPGPPRRLTIELAEDVDGAAPGQLACLMDGELVVGWGTITRPRACRSGERTLNAAPAGANAHAPRA